MCIINGALAPFFKGNLVEDIKTKAYSVAIDGSNDTGIEKTNPITVSIHDSVSGKIVTRFLDMCSTTGKFNCFDTLSDFTDCEHMQVGNQRLQRAFSVLEDNQIPWSNCVGISVDNTSVNLGRTNSISTRVLQKNPNTYLMGCPCLIVLFEGCKEFQRCKQTIIVHAM